VKKLGPNIAMTCQEMPSCLIGGKATANHRKRRAGHDENHQRI
jgi:hypothetical protein